MSNNDYMTIQEASVFSGLAISTLYKAIQKGILPIEYDIVHGKKLKKVLKADIIRVFNLSHSTVLHDRISDITPDITQYNTIEHDRISDITQYNTIEYDRISDIVQENIKKVLEEKQSQLMKPLEEQALFISGKLTQENQFLKQRLETILQENELLKEQVKALPGPTELETKENTILLLEKEKDELETKIKQEEKKKTELEVKLKLEEKEKDRAIATTEEAIKQLKLLPAPVESIHQILLDNANNIKELTKERDKFQTVLKEHEATIKEKEKILKDIEELRKQELEDLKKQTDEEKARLKSEAEEREKQIAEAWKKELELAKKPWWKFW